MSKDRKIEKPRSALQRIQHSKNYNVYWRCQYLSLNIAEEVFDCMTDYEVNKLGSLLRQHEQLTGEIRSLLKRQHDKTTRYHKNLKEGSPASKILL